VAVTKTTTIVNVLNLIKKQKTILLMKAFASVTTMQTALAVKYNHGFLSK
jgi:hypothetical protein